MEAIKKKAGESDVHKQLKMTAIHWLYGRGCDLFAMEVPIPGDIADAIGVRRNSGDYKTPGTSNDVVYFIEAKASRSDMICLKQKASYLRSISHPACDLYYLIVAEGIIVEDDLYPMWGVINHQGIIVRKAKRMGKKEIDQNEYYSHKKDIIRSIAHSLVYRVYGKLYLH